MIAREKRLQKYRILFIFSCNSSCNTVIEVKIRKANANFGRLNDIWIFWKSKKLHIKIETRLYESLALLTLQYTAETWPVTVYSQYSKKLEAPHHKWLRKLLDTNAKRWSQKKRSDRQTENKKRNVWEDGSSSLSPTQYASRKKNITNTNQVDFNTLRGNDSKKNRQV